MREYNSTLLLRWLARHDPRWSERHQTTVSGDQAAPLTIVRLQELAAQARVAGDDE